MEGFKAIVIVGRPSNRGPFPRRGYCSAQPVAYAFKALSPALAFMRGTKSQKVVVEFGVEVETLDFYDAVKALKVPVIFSANILEPAQLGEFDISVSNVVYADQRPEPISGPPTKASRSGPKARSPTSA